MRLSSLLRGLLDEDQTLQDALEVLSARLRDPYGSEEIKRRLEVLRTRMTALSQQTVEGELQNICEILSHQSRDRQRKLEVLGRRYGWDGEGGATLQEAANYFGVSRERVRQICQPSEATLKNRSAWMPALERAIQWLQEQVPLPVDKAGPKLKEEGITRSELSFQALQRIARLMRRDLPFETDVVGEITFLQSVHAQEGNDRAAQILSQARRQISRWGVATIEDIAAHVSEKRKERENSDDSADEAGGESAPEADTAFVERILSAQSDFALLDANAGWFWLSSVTRNGLITQIEKVLAVAPRVRIADLRAGASRNDRRRGFAPPQRISWNYVANYPTWKLKAMKCSSGTRGKWTGRYRRLNK